MNNIKKSLILQKNFKKKFINFTKEMKNQKINQNNTHNNTLITKMK